jgi:hypothetical protein
MLRHSVCVNHLGRPLPHGDHGRQRFGPVERRRVAKGWKGTSNLAAN